MRHILGILGVIAASVLLVVSMMMNYQFGSSLGKTPTDAHIYGMASAAADCFKALAPFFFFAAIRNRVWSQALAAVVVWVVVTGYAFTSALGHAALNRFDTSGQRVVAGANYKDLRADLKRAEDQLKWIPPHRPPSTVAAEINVMQADRKWLLTKECTDATMKSSREFCQQYFKLSAELASGHEAEKLRVKIAGLGAQTAKTTGSAVIGEADPQAGVIARLIGVEIGTVQTGLMLFVAVLIEIGSGFGMYVAFAYWRPHQNLHGGSRPAGKPAQTQPARREEEPQAAGEDGTPATGRADPIWSSDPSAADAAGPPSVRALGHNDNDKSAKSAIMPPNDVQRFYLDYVVSAPMPSHVGSSDLNEAYKLWCRRNGRRPLVMPNFLAEFDELKVEKHDINGVKYFGIALRDDVRRDVEKRASRRRKGAHPQETAGDEPRPAVADTDAAVDRLRAAADQMRASLENQPDAPPDKVRAA